MDAGQVRPSGRMAGLHPASLESNEKRVHGYRMIAMFASASFIVSMRTSAGLET